MAYPADLFIKGNWAQIVVAIACDLETWEEIEEKQRNCQKGIEKHPIDTLQPEEALNRYKRICEVILEYLVNHREIQTNRSSVMLARAHLKNKMEQLEEWIEIRSMYADRQIDLTKIKYRE